MTVELLRASLVKVFETEDVVVRLTQDQHSVSIVSPFFADKNELERYETARDMLKVTKPELLKQISKFYLYADAEGPYTVAGTLRTKNASTEVATEAPLGPGELRVAIMDIDSDVLMENSHENLTFLAKPTGEWVEPIFLEDLRELETLGAYYPLVEVTADDDKGVMLLKLV